jgi:hypothetical protein
MVLVLLLEPLIGVAVLLLVPLIGVAVLLLIGVAVLLIGVAVLLIGVAVLLIGCTSTLSESTCISAYHIYLHIGLSDLLAYTLRIS